MNKDYSTKSGYISIIGCPNVGKSTILNLLVGEKLAIVTDKPQTTRDKIIGIRTEKENQMIFLDTPGIHKDKGKSKLNKKMVRQARQALTEADLILFVINASNPFPADEQEDIFPLLKKMKCPILLLINKIDLIEKKQLLPLIEKYNSLLPFKETFPICALCGENVTKLIPTITHYLPQGPHYYPEDTLTDRPLRFYTAEIIREKIITLTKQELPYSTAVIIESFVENPPDAIVRIAATILVRRASQKGIIIGKQGSMLKNKGQQARMDIEKSINRKVFLELWVKVSKDWPDNDRVLKELGY